MGSLRRNFSGGWDDDQLPPRVQKNPTGKDKRAAFLAIDELHRIKKRYEERVKAGEEDDSEGLSEDCRTEIIEEARKLLRRNAVKQVCTVCQQRVRRGHCKCWLGDQDDFE